MAQDKKQIYKSLLFILASNCPEDCKEILKKYKGENCRTSNPKEIEMKLARMYALSPSKLEIEKDFAKIHPHKEFILKNESVKNSENPIEKVVEEGEIKKSPIVIESEQTNNKEIPTTCGCKCAENTFSNADSTIQQPEYSTFQRQDNQPIFMLSIIGIVAVCGMFFYLKK